MNDLVKQLKIPFLTVLLMLALLYLFTAVLGPIPFSVKSTTTTTSDMFTVTGMGEEKATPDSSEFIVGVTKTASTVKEAKDQVNSATNTIIEKFKALGIEDKAIKTQNFSSYPNYGALPVKPLSVSSATLDTFTIAAPADDSNTITGYTVTQELQVTTKSVDLANKALDAAVASGANQISGVTFAINDEDRKVLQQKARKAAIADAKSKAKDIAADAGIKLGKVVNIYVSDDQPVAMYARKDAMMSAGTQESEPTNLQPGENTVTVNVTLSYETL